MPSIRLTFWTKGAKRRDSYWAHAPMALHAVVINSKWISRRLVWDGTVDLTDTEDSIVCLNKWEALANEVSGQCDHISVPLGIDRCGLLCFDDGYEYVHCCLPFSECESLLEWANRIDILSQLTCDNAINIGPNSLMDDKKALRLVANSAPIMSFKAHGTTYVSALQSQLIGSP